MDYLKFSDEELVNSYVKGNSKSFEILMNKYKESFPFLQKDLKISEILLGKNHPDTAICYHSLGKYYKYIREYTNSLTFYEKDLKITLDILGETHLSTAITYNSLAELYELLKNYNKAKQFYTKALKIREKILPPKHPSLIDLKKKLEIVKQKLKKEK